LAILDKMQITAAMTDGKLIAALNQRLHLWAPLLQKMSMGLDEEKAIIYGLECAATSAGDGTTSTATAMSDKLGSGPSFRFLLQTLHDKEVLSEEALLAWKEERKDETEDTPLVGKLFHLQLVQEFLEWLEEESEEEGSDDDEDSD
jgi:translation initiation factor eIF-2B subunit epsilon